MVAEQTSHFFVSGLVEVEIPLSDRRKRLRRAKAHDLIGDRRQLITSLTRSDRNGDHDRKIGLSLNWQRRNPLK